MQDAKRSLIATGGVLAVIAATVFGASLRNRMEIGPGIAVGGSITLDGLVTSTSGIPGAAENADGPISESTYFYQLTLLLEKEFVDPIEDDQALAIGAVRGMVNSLADSNSAFLKPEQMAAMKERRNGTFQGIGVEVKLQFNEAELRKLQNQSIGSAGADSDANFDPVLLIPTVVVTTVVPGSPAEIAGIRVGDRIMRVNGKWALSSEEVAMIRDLRGQFDAGNITAEQLQRSTNDFREKFESNISPARVADEVLIGKDGDIDLEWRRPDAGQYKATLTKRVSELRALRKSGGSVRLRFFTGTPDILRDTKLPNDTLLLDLRQSTSGDYEAMRECLEILAPKGEYGTIRREQAGAPRKLTVKDGTDQPRKIRLIVDGSTQGAAAIFAMALVSAGVAQVESGELSTDLPWIEVFDLPDGSGYTLRTGTFFPKEATK